MPTIPLFNPNAAPDAWHQVRAPGGYECWRLAANDPANDVQLFVELWEGDLRDAKYRDAFDRFLRSPTRQSPPAPASHIAVRAEVFRGAKVAAESVVTIAQELFAAQTDRLNVRAGAIQLSSEDGVGKLSLVTDEIVASLELRSRSRIAPLLVGLPHQRIYVDSVCEAKGEIRIVNANQTISFRGDCFKDHLLGDRPMSKDVVDLFVVAGERAIALRILDRQVSATEFNSLGAQAIDAGAAEIDWVADLPASIRIDRVIRLSNPRRLDVSHATYDAEFRGTSSIALCTFGH